MSISDFEGLTEIEKEAGKDWAKDTLKIFLGQASKKEVQQKQRFAVQDFGKKVQAERKANLNWLKAVDAMLHRGVGYGLDKFAPKRVPVVLPKTAKRYVIEVLIEEKIEKRSCVALEDGTRYLEVPRQTIRGCRVPGPVLHVATDQGPVGGAALSFMRAHLSLRMSVTYDLYHRVINDWLGGISESNLVVLRWEHRALVRMREGPFATHSNHSLLGHIALEFFEVFDEECELFTILYDKIVAEDAELRADADVGQASHYSKTWQKCKSMLTTRVAGETPSMSRWWSYETAGRIFSRQRSMTLMVLLWLGLRRKWFKHATDPLLGFQQKPLDIDNDEALPGEDAEEVDRAEPPEDGLSEEDYTKTTAKARTACQKRRSAVSTLKLSLQLLCSTKRRRVWQGMCWLCRPLQVWFEDAVPKCKKITSTADFLQALCDNELLLVVLDLFQHFLSPDMSRHMEMLRAGQPPRTEHKLKEDKFVAETLWSTLVKTCGHLAETNVGFLVPPMAFIPLVSTAALTRNLRLAQLHKDWDWLEKLEREAHDDCELATWLFNVVFAKDTWARELFIQLLECGWTEVSAEVHFQIDSFSKTWLSSLIIEEAFNDIRRVSALHRGLKCDPSGAWHILASGAVLTSHGREGVTIEARAEAAAATSSPSLHIPKQATCSWSDERLSDLTAQRPQRPFPHQSVENYRHSSLAWMLLQKAEGSWQRMRKAWKSQLLASGMVFYDMEEKVLKLVLHSTHYGYLAAHLLLDTTTRKISFPSQPKRKITFGFLEEYANVKVFVLHVLPPGAPGNQRSDVVGLYLARGAQPLLTHCAKLGFPGLTLTRLKQLAVCEAVAFVDDDKISEKDAVRRLLRQVLGADFTEELFEAAWASRKGQEVKEPELLASHFFEAIDQEDLLLDLDGDAEMAADWDELQLARQRASRRQPQEPPADVAPPGASAPSAGANQAVADNRQRRFVTYRADGLSQVEADLLLPPSAKIFKDCRENRWRMSSKLLPGSGTKSKSWGRRSHMSDFGAMLVVIKAAWQAHFEHTGEACPFDFEEQPGS